MSSIFKYMLILTFAVLGVSLFGCCFGAIRGIKELMVYWEQNVKLSACAITIQMFIGGIIDWLYRAE